MSKRPDAPFPVLLPAFQISFAAQLRVVREQFLDKALRAAVTHIDLRQLDTQLADLVPARSLRAWQRQDFGVNWSSPCR